MSRFSNADLLQNKWKDGLATGSARVKVTVADLSYRPKEIAQARDLDDAYAVHAVEVHGLPLADVKAWRDSLVYEDGTPAEPGTFAREAVERLHPHDRRLRLLRSGQSDGIPGDTTTPPHWMPEDACPLMPQKAKRTRKPKPAASEQRDGDVSV